MHVISLNIGIVRVSGGNQIEIIQMSAKVSYVP